jgi:hypothetical protein
MSAGHAGHVDPANKKVALLIALLALVLAFAETLGKAAQTSALAYHIESSNRTAAEQLEAESGPKASEAVKKQIDAWKKTAERYQSEPETNEGRKELAARAKEGEAKRDRFMAAYHNYEVASAAVQIAIVLASAQIITGVAALLWIAYALGAIGIVFSLIGLLWPAAVHVF